ncbi:Initiator Replication protein [Cetobacterium ceti]|uniref:Initiator Replication protein n=1 Tax=Cetobacterium ceti TaxID=180163 RepID=A0A1T4LDN3_9FUSO|nr:replication initiation protein [Cetobacterium ceti]SJZ52869.1 Initiator Replication protein [Cetobacterium ceti]
MQKSFFIEFSKKLNKKERELLQLLNFQKNFTSISFEKLFDIFELKDEEKILNLEKYLSKLFQKHFILLDENKNIIQRIHIFINYSIKNNEIIFQFNPDILNENISKLLIFKEQYSYRLYQYINNSQEKNFQITLEEIREIFQIQNTYERFFDIEKNILKPTFKDLNLIGKLNVLYTKEKLGEYKNGKIIGIKVSKQEGPLLTLTKSFKNLFELHSELMKLYKELNGENSYLSTYHFNSKLLIKIYNIKDGETLIYSTKNLIFNITYNKLSPCLIQIYKKKD